MRGITNTFRRSFPLRLLIGLVASAAVLALIGILANAGYFQGPDLTIRDDIKTLEFPSLTSAMLIITRLGSTLFLVPAGIAVIPAFAYFRWRVPIYLFIITMAGQAVLHLGFKALFYIDRPEALLDYVIGDTHSFPSGHAMASLSFYGMLAFLVTRRLNSRLWQVPIWIVSGSLIFLIGFSRVYFGVHHPSDVLAGFLAAFIWTAAVASGAE